MEFCQHCGTRLFPSRVTELSCVKCGYVKNHERQKVQFYPPKANHEGVVVVDEQEAALFTQPTTRVSCPQCENRNAYCRLAETGDEESIIEVQILRCTRCGHTWRETG